jgi:hypothetical protein
MINADFVYFGNTIVEIKTVSKLTDTHKAQIRKIPRSKLRGMDPMCVYLTAKAKKSFAR